MFNLIPEEKKKKLEKEYTLRLSATATIFLGSICLVALILLIPSYVISNSRLKEAQKKNDALISALSLSNTKSATDVLKTISADSDALKGTLQYPALASLIETIATSKPEGIVINSIDFSSGSSPDTVTLGGVASTRDSLVAFSGLFQSNPLFQNASLPISDFAKDRDIDFSLTLSLKS